MRERRTEPAHVETEQESLETEAEGGGERTRFSAAGPLPPVVNAAEPAGPSASERAYGEHGLSSGGKVMEHEEQVDGAAVAEASQRYDIPEVDILAVITQESRGKATANAGARQHDHGRHAASGLMQVTASTWKATQHKHPELAHYAFETHRYDRRVNILVGTAALADKRHALTKLGVPPDAVNGALATMAFNAGEGIVAKAYHNAVHGGSQNPGDDCMRAEYLKPAIAHYPSVYAYYLTGAGKSKNPHRTVEKAIDLKFHEISKYPVAVENLVAEAEEHHMADDELDMPKAPGEGETKLA